MKKVKTLLVVLLVAAVVATAFGIATGSASNSSTDNETGNITFEEFESGNITILWYQRQIGDAIVEGDFVNRQLNANTGELIEETKHWREDLPIELPQNLITQDEALAIAGGGNSSRAYLYYIAPDSAIYRPAPKNPCWVVWETREAKPPDCECQKCGECESYKYRFGTIIDAATGKILGSGIPPILSDEILPGETCSTVVLDNGVEATYLGKTPDGNSVWQATFGAPKYLDDLVTPISCHWSYDTDKEEWHSDANLFSATVKGDKVNVEYQGVKMHWQPRVEIESEQQTENWSILSPVDSPVDQPHLEVESEKQEDNEATLLTVDPINENYSGNTLQWDYGNGITRNLRIIEGMLIEYYTIGSLPTGNITIKTNTDKDDSFVWTRPEVAWDANYTPVDLIVDGDDVTLTLDAMLNATLPITIDPPTSFTTSDSDGCLEFYPAVSYDVAWKSTKATTISDSGYYFLIGQYFDHDRYYVGRSFVYYNTTSLPDENMNIIDVKLRLRGSSDLSDQDFYIQVQSGMPDHPCDRMAKTDYNKEYYGYDVGGQLCTLNFVVGSYNEIPLYSIYRDWINTSGWTKFCLRSSRDIDYQGWKPTGYEVVGFYSYEIGEGYRPELVVTYEIVNDEAFAFAGPYNSTNCEQGGWIDFAQQASEYFTNMGYPTLVMAFPPETVIERRISSNETAIFYEHAHGGWQYFISSCNDTTFFWEVEDWIEDYPKMPFTFLGSCEALCDVGPDTLVSAFTKGSTRNTVVVGYCGLSGPECDAFVVDRKAWDQVFFFRLSIGNTVGEAYSKACNVYPSCNGTGAPCIRFFGDPNLRLVPKIYRNATEITGYITGEVRDVNGDLITNITVQLYKKGYGLVAETNTGSGSTYNFTVYDTGEYWLVASG